MNPSSRPQSAVTSATTLWHIPPVPMVMLLITGSLHAGDLTTDNLTVKRTATVWEKVDIQAPTGSAPTNGLILYYALATNSTTAYDDSGSGMTGTVMNGATWVTNGIKGGAFSFDGSNDRIEAAPTSTPWVTNQVSVSLWAKYAGTGGTRILFSISSTLDNTGSKYWIESGGWSDTSIRFAIQQVSTGAGSGVTPTIGEWYHVVGTYDGATLRIYVNGSLSGSSAVTYSQTTTAVVRVGYDDSCSTFSGVLDEIRVYNRPLSADEVKGLYYNEYAPTNAESTLTVKNGIQQIAETATNVLMGKLGVGTNAPSTLLDVNGDATVRGTLTVSGSISGSGAGLFGLDATNLTSGTIPIARLSGVTSNELAATERDKLDAAQNAAQVVDTVASILSTNVAADSAKLGGIAADAFATLSSNQVWTGVNAFEHEVHLIYGTYLGGASLYTKDGSGYGGGNVYMDGGSLYMKDSSSAYLYGSNCATTASIKIGNNGCLDLEGSSGIVYHPPLGNLSMGVYTNR